MITKEIKAELVQKYLPEQSELDKILIPYNWLSLKIDIQVYPFIESENEVVVYPHYIFVNLIKTVNNESWESTFDYTVLEDEELVIDYNDIITRSIDAFSCIPKIEEFLLKVVHRKEKLQKIKEKLKK